MYNKALYKFIYLLSLFTSHLKAYLVRVACNREHLIDDWVIRPRLYSTERMHKKCRFVLYCTVTVFAVITVVSLLTDHTRASTVAVSSVHNTCCWQDGRPSWSSNIYDDKPDDDDDDNYDSGGRGAGEKSARRRQELSPLGDDVPYTIQRL